jgi:iron complex outermembrane receptor protein
MYAMNDWNRFAGAVNFQRENHQGKNNGKDTKKIAENVWSLGTEYTIRPFSFWERRPLSFSAGAGFDLLRPVSFWAEPYESPLAGDIIELTQTPLRYMFSWQGGIFFDVTKDHTLRVTYAKKNHIPLMAHRYDTLSESETYTRPVIPNPNLKNETAGHYEVGYLGAVSHAFSDTFKPILGIDAALYYADLTDMIAEAEITSATGGKTRTRVNIDKTAYYGFEAGLTLTLDGHFSFGGTLSVNRYEIKEGAEGWNIENNFPRTTASAYMEIRPLASLEPAALKTLTVIPAFEYEGPRYGHFEVLTAGDPLDRYALFALKITSELNEHFSISAGIENLFDTNYSLDSAYLPMPGRTFSFAFTAKY